MPRSPLPQSPAGRLNSTWVRPFFFSALGDHLGRMVIGADIFDALEAGVGGGIEAVEEIVLGKEHRKIG